VNSTRVCVDASLILKLFLAESDSAVVDDLWATWLNDATELLAPVHLAYEVTSVIRNRVHRDLLGLEDGEKAVQAFQAQPITLVPPGPFHHRAWALAEQFQRPTLYDAYYLALAESADCELWTADERLVNAVGGKLTWLRSLRDHRPTPPGSPHPSP
jgi:predicted nucleic acid-binding protein